MRLEEHQQAVELADARGLQRSADFRRVMAIVVDHRDVVDHALNVEASADTREFAEAFADQLCRNVQIERDSSGSGGVAHVVNAWRMEELEYAEVVAFVGQAKFTAEAFELDVGDDEIGLTRSAVGDDRALHVWNNGLHVGLVNAQNRRAVKGHAIDELHEGILNIFERGILVQMLAVDGGHDSDDGRKQQEAAVAFVGFDHEEFAFAESCRSSGLIDAPADDKRGIKMRSRKHRGDDGGRGGLAVRAGHRDAVFQPHQLGQHFRARDYRNLSLVRFHDFRIVSLYR